MSTPHERVELTPEAIAEHRKRLAEVIDAAEQRAQRRSLAELITAAEKWMDEAARHMHRMSDAAEEGRMSYATYDSARFDYWEVAWDRLGGLIAAYRREEQR